MCHTAILVRSCVLLPHRPLIFRVFLPAAVRVYAVRSPCRSRSVRLPQLLERRVPYACVSFGVLRRGLRRRDVRGGQKNGDGSVLAEGEGIIQYDIFVHSVSRLLLVLADGLVSDRFCGGASEWRRWLGLVHTARCPLERPPLVVLFVCFLVAREKSSTSGVVVRLRRRVRLGIARSGDVMEARLFTAE